MKNQTEDDEDAIMVLAKKSKEVFLSLFKDLLETETEAVFKREEAMQIALTLTPKPMEMLSTLWAQNFQYDEDDLTDEEEVPDDPLLHGYFAEETHLEHPQICPGCNRPVTTADGQPIPENCSCKRGEANG